MKESYKDKIKKDLENCIDCGRCMNVCPMMNKFSKSPLDLMEKLKDEKIEKNEVAYSCLFCDSCSKVCPKDIDLKETFEIIRNDLYGNNRKTLKKQKLYIIENYQKVSFGKFTTTTKLKKGTKKVFIPGCSLLSQNYEGVLKTSEYLKKNIKDIDILVKCCGKPSKDIGDRKSFYKNIEEINKFLKENFVEEVIVACENCYVTFKENLKGIKVISLWEIIDEIGVPKEIIGLYKGKEKFALHDPCPIKKEKNIHNSVRNILNEIGLEFEEFKFNKENTRCCGNGGMIFITNKDLHLEVRNNRANETELNNIVSYCQSCVTTLKKSEKNTLHILDFLFDEKVINGERINSETVGFLKSWKNRLNLKKLKGEK